MEGNNWKVHTIFVLRNLSVRGSGGQGWKIGWKN